MKVAVLFSGGKDSTMALHKAIEEGHDVKYIVAMVSDNPESYMYHVPNIHLTELSSKALEIPLIKKVTHGRKEEELEDLIEVLEEMKDKGVEGIYSGALYSTYQKSRIDKICWDLELQSYAPLWHRGQKEYMEEIIELGFEVIITSVSAEGLDDSWLGRKIDKGLLEELRILHEKYGINMAFEGGEAETLVLDCPIFKSRIDIIKAKKEWLKDHGFFLIEEAVLEEKS